MHVKRENPGNGRTLSRSWTQRGRAVLPWVGALLFGIQFAAPATGQLDLPRQRVRKAGAPVRVLPKPPPSGELAPKDPEQEELPLVLPERREPEEDGTQGLLARGPGEARAAQVFEDLARMRRPTEVALAEAASELAELGPGALLVARSELASEKPGPLRAAARLLLESGTAEDRALVAERLRRTPLPSSAAAPILETLLVHDPVLCSEGYLAGLLESRSSALRKVVFDSLVERARPSLLPALAAVLGTSSTRARSLAIDLVRRVPGEDANRILLACLGDRSTEVARAAAEELSLRDDVVASLRELAFGKEHAEESASSRSASYALLTLVAREDRTGRALLRDEDIARLLEGLARPEPLLAGASAIALAGIGVHTEGSVDTSWLDGKVPHTLVRLATGDVFFPDFSAVEELGTRRLALLTGQSFGGNGAAWQAWWAEHANGFRARRAVLPLLAGDEGRLVVVLVEGRRRTTLVGPELAKAHATEPAAPLFLDRDQALRLAGRLQATGVFGSEHPPGSPRTEDADALILRIGEREKTLPRPPPGVGVGDWYRRAVEAVHAAERDTEWQVWFDRTEFRSLFDAWVNDLPTYRSLSDAERRVFLSRRVLVRLPRLPPGERDPGLRLLARLQEGGALFTASDVGLLLGLLGEEEEWGGPTSRAHVLFGMVRSALAMPFPGQLSGDAEDPDEHGALRSRFVDTLAARFGMRALDEVTAALEYAGRTEPAVLLDPAAGEVLRAAAARVLGRRLSDPRQEGSARERAGFLRLLRDPSSAVRAEAAREAGEHGFGFATPALVSLAERGDGVVRARALRALAKMGASEARGMCVLALSDGEPRLSAAAAEALADLAELRSGEEGSGGEVSLLASLFARGPASPVFAGARRGLIALGEAGQTELLRLLAHPERSVRREAALALAEQGQAEGASTLLTLLTEDPDDRRVADELALLTCFDPRAAGGDPVAAWWDWWDRVTHGDALEWFRAAALRTGFEVPEREALAGDGTREGALFLLELAWNREAGDSLVGRARRELARVLAVPIPRPPREPQARLQGREQIRAAIEARFQTR